MSNIAKILLFLHHKQSKPNQNEHYHQPEAHSRGSHSPHADKLHRRQDARHRCVSRQPSRELRSVAENRQRLPQRGPAPHRENIVAARPESHAAAPHRWHNSHKLTTVSRGNNQQRRVAEPRARERHRRQRVHQHEPHGHQGMAPVSLEQHAHQGRQGKDYLHRGLQTC